MKCSFCGKSKDTVALIFAGPNVAICDECVQVCLGIIFDRTREERARRVEAATQAGNVPNAEPVTP